MDILDVCITYYYDRCLIFVGMGLGYGGKFIPTSGYGWPDGVIFLSWVWIWDSNTWWVFTHCHLYSWHHTSYAITLRHTKIRVPIDWSLGELFNNPEASAKIGKWATELSSYNIVFELRKAMKSQVLADFIVYWTGSLSSNCPNAETT
jgi:hypothetical protein